MSDEVELAVLSASFDAAEGAAPDLAAALARYVVLTRREPGCRNVDLLASTTVPARLLVVEKWDHAEAARAHLDSDLATAMAADVTPLLAARPSFDLWDAVSAHDLH